MTIERNHIGWAMYKLKTGYRVRRRSWATDHKLVYIVPFAGPMAPYIILQNSHSPHIPWTASQDDLMAEDWESPHTIQA